MKNDQTIKGGSDKRGLRSSRTCRRSRNPNRKTCAPTFRYIAPFTCAAQGCCRSYTLSMLVWVAYQADGMSSISKQHERRAKDAGLGHGSHSLHTDRTSKQQSLAPLQSTAWEYVGSLEDQREIPQKNVQWTRPNHTQRLANRQLRSASIHRPEHVG